MSNICGNINFSLVRLRSTELHAGKLINDHVQENQRSFLIGALEFAVQNSGFSYEYENSFLCVTTISNQIVANAVILERTATVRSWNVYYFVVDYDQRRRAVGSKTVGFIKGAARSSGILQIDACVLDDNITGLKFWSENGFIREHPKIVINFEHTVHVGSLLRYQC